MKELNKPLVYIVLPCYNSEKYLLEQLMSIYNQNYQNWFLIFVNDGSTDSSLEIAKKFAKDYNLEEKVKIISQKNSWVNSAVQKWLEEITVMCDIDNTDSLVAYCDSDDIWTREKLSIQVDFMVENPDCSMSFHDLVFIDENWILKNKSLLQNKYIKDFSFFFFAVIWNFIVYSTAMMFRPKHIKEIIPMPVWFRIYQDHWTLLVLLVLGYNIHSIDKKLSYYRRWHTSLSKIANNTWIKKAWPAYVKYFTYLQKRFPDKNLSYVISYNTDRFIKWPEKFWFISIPVVFLILFKYPKVFFLSLKVVIYKLIRYWTIK